MASILTPKEALQLAVCRAGDQSALANLLGVTQQTISNWLLRHGQVPAEHVRTIEGLVGVSRHDLRPDIYPREEMVDHKAAGRWNGVDQTAARFAA